LYQFVFLEPLSHKPEVEGSSPSLDTTNHTPRTPTNRDFQDIRETFGKLSRAEKHLKKIGIYNTKHLLKREKTYYFVIRIDKNCIVKKSLFTNNLTLSIILREKILKRLKMWEIRKGFITAESKNTVTIVAENEEEEKLIKEITATITNKINRLSKTHNVSSTTLTTRDKNTLKRCSEHFLNFRELAKTSNKTLIKYKQAINYLNMYFGENTLVKNIDKLEASNFRNFLLQLPRNYKSIKELEGKNLRTLTESATGKKLLDKYERQALRTVDEVIVKAKTLFNYFAEQVFIYNNPFQALKKLSNDKRTEERAFEAEELKAILQHTIKHNLREDYNFIKSMLHTGMRRGEMLSLRVKDIDFEKSFIDTKGTKTEYALRIIPLHIGITDIIKEQTQNKDKEDFVFYDMLKDVTQIYREESVGTNTNKIFKEVLGERIKGEINIRSLRQNFAQITFLSDNFNDLNHKSLMGHSTKNDITDKHYIRMRRDYKLLKELMDKVDFSEFCI